MIYLDGIVVEATVIDPSKHRFLGAFRPPIQPTTNGAAALLCPCGHMLWFVEHVGDHWRQGHFDDLQYETIMKSAAQD